MIFLIEVFLETADNLQEKKIEWGMLAEKIELGMHDVKMKQIDYTV